MKGSMPMIKTKPELQKRKKAFRCKLETKQQEVFDQICKHIKQKRSGLPWYHKLGMLVKSLIPPGVEQEGRINWLEKPAGALGLSPSLLQKAVRFYDEYPSHQDVEELQRKGVGWTRLYVSFGVADKKARHALLSDSTLLGWTARDLRFEAQHQYPTKRRGIGGRSSKPLTTFGPARTLREMKRVTNRWLEFYSHVWNQEAWKSLLQDWAPESRAKLKNLMTELDYDLDCLLKKGQEARDRLAGFRQEVGLS
jgi:hypothetical protein